LQGSIMLAQVEQFLSNGRGTFFIDLSFKPNPFVTIPMLFLICHEVRWHFLIQRLSNIEDELCYL